MTLQQKHDPHFAMQSKCTPQQAADYFGLSVEQVLELAGQDGTSVIDRFELEKQLQREQLISLDWLALRFGIPTLALEKAMKQVHTKRLRSFPLDGYGKDGYYLLPLRLAEAWIKELLPLHKTWKNLDARARDLAAVIGCEVRPCAASQFFGEEPASVATCRCAVSGTDVSRAHQEYLDNGKFMSLEPDHIGWHTLYQDMSWRNRLMRNDLNNLEEFLSNLGRSLPA